MPVVLCRRCGINVFGDDSAHVLRMPFGIVPAIACFCATCWPIVVDELEHERAAGGPPQRVQVVEIPEDPRSN